MKFYTAQEIENKVEEYFREDETTRKILGADSKFSGFLKTVVDVIKRVFVEVVFGSMTEIYNSIFYSTSDREALILHLRDEGLAPWKTAKVSTGKVRIGSTTLPDGKREIPLRTVIKTDDVVPKYYVTTEAGYIDPTTPEDFEGNYTVELSIQSLEKGGMYNVASGAICEMDSSLTGIDCVFNSEQTSGGRDDETIEEVRTRLIDRNVGKTEKTASWFVSETKNNFDFVVDCACIPRLMGRGTVGIAVRVSGGVDPTLQQLSAIENHFNTDELDPAGGWRVYATHMISYVWNASVKVFYTDESNIPTDENLNNALSLYFAELVKGGEIIEDWIVTSILNNVNNVKKIEIISHSGYNTPAGSYPTLGNVSWEKEKYE